MLSAIERADLVRLLGDKGRAAEVEATFARNDPRRWRLVEVDPKAEKAHALAMQQIGATAGKLAVLLEANRWAWPHVVAGPGLPGFPGLFAEKEQAVPTDSVSALMVELGSEVQRVARWWQTVDSVPLLNELKGVEARAAALLKRSTAGRKNRTPSSVHRQALINCANELVRLHGIRRATGGRSRLVQLLGIFASAVGMTVDPRDVLRRHEAHAAPLREAVRHACARTLGGRFTLGARLNSPSL